MSPHFLIIREAHCRSPPATTVMRGRTFDLSHATNIFCTASNEELLNSNRIHQVYQRLQDLYRSGRCYRPRSLHEKSLLKLLVDRVSLDDPTTSRPRSLQSSKAARPLSQSQTPERGRKSPARRRSFISLS